MNKTIAMLIALLCLMAQGAWAEDVSYIYYTVNSDGKTVTKHTDGTASNPTAITSSTRKLDAANTERWYVVNSNVTITTKERLDCYGTVNIILKDGCTLTVPKGIRVSTSCTLNIYAQSEAEATMGGIHAEGGGEDWAAIGGHKNYRGGTLNIHGGNIYAEAKHNNAAGIGGGNGDGSGMVAINIFGGKITAKGKDSGAGIGGGQHNNYPGTISIYGGNVTATGGKSGAGIGGGEDRGGWDTYICGGTITATGGDNGAGIGGGEEGDGGNINIYGGNITATGGTAYFIANDGGGAGIGGGYIGSGGNIYIKNGTVTATGGAYAAGIGGAGERNGGTITIDGGTITARGNEGGAGIGGGFLRDGGSITINGGTVKAYGSDTSKYGYCSAGIGGGRGGWSGTIIINGGNVYAEGGRSSFSSGGAPGIGAGSNVSGYDITINGGKVTSYSGQGAPSIGHGISSGNVFDLTGNEGTLTLNNNRKVTIWYRYPIEKEKREEYLLKCMIEKDGKLTQANVNYFSYAVIEGCKHTSFLYTVDDEDKHHVYCKYCEYETEGDHVYNEGFCTTCGYNHVDYDVAIYRGLYDATGYASHVTYDVVPGRDFAVPAAPATTPEHMVFKGWKMVSGTDAAPLDWEMTEGEELLEPGTVLTPTADFRLYARYLRNYTTEWEWAANYRSATLKLYNKAEDTTPVATIEASSVSQTPVEATLEQTGSLTSVATATYTSAGGHTYTFSDTQVVTSYYALALGEEDNSSVINTGNGVQVTATLIDRALYKDDSWNTLCLPFDVEDGDDSDYLTFSGTPLEGAILKELESAEFESATGSLTLNFVEASRIKAGHPYLIKWDKPAGYEAYNGSNASTCSDIVSPVFTGVTLNSQLQDEECTISDEQSITFKGTYSKIPFGEENRSILFLGAANSLYYPQAGAYVGAQRAYFQLEGLTAGDPVVNGIKAFVLNFGDEETGIREISNPSNLSNPSNSSNSWFTLDGRKLYGKPAAKGVYINNGKKVIIK